MFPTPLPPRELRRVRRLTTSDLSVLWVNRARHLAQTLHLSTRGASELNTPEQTRQLIRDASRVLLENIIILGKASVKFGSYGTDDRPEFYVPPDATVLFAAIEKFVDDFGFHGDEDPVARASIFDNLCILQGSMVIHPGYLDYPIDFPNFSLTEDDLRSYGVYDFMKRNQVASILRAHDPSVHSFGENLRRYHPELRPEDWYKFFEPKETRGLIDPSVPIAPVSSLSDTLSDKLRVSPDWAAPESAPGDFAPANIIGCPRLLIRQNAVILAGTVVTHAPSTIEEKRVEGGWGISSKAPPWAENADGVVSREEAEERVDAEVAEGSRKMGMDGWQVGVEDRPRFEREEID